MMLDPARFDAFLNEVGQRVHWRRASDCPCRDARSGAADVNCESCRGLGTLWDPPVDAMVAVTGQKARQEWAKLGMWVSGDQFVTIPTDSPAFAMRLTDRVTMVDSTARFSVVVKCDQKLRYPVLSIEQALVNADAGVVAITPPTVESDGTLVWETTPTQAYVSLSGVAHPEYYAFQELTQDRAHFHGTLFPRYVVLRRFDLFGR